MSERKGSYIVVEGSDGVGKTTQLDLLRRKLDELKIDAVFTREPGGGMELGQEVRRLLLSPEVPIQNPLTEIALFTADRAEAWTQIIEPALAEDKLVVSDRNWYSTLAYQTADDPSVEDKIITVTKALLPERYVNPDLAIILSLSEAERRRRRDEREGEKTADSFEMRNVEYFEKVHRIYETIPRRMGAVAISANQSREAVFCELWQHAEPFIP